MKKYTIKRMIPLFILIAIIFFFTGFALGVQVTINQGVDLAMGLVHLNKINISIDEDALQSLLMRYASSAKIS